MLGLSRKGQPFFLTGSPIGAENTLTTIYGSTHVAFSASVPGIHGFISFLRSRHEKTIKLNMSNGRYTVRFSYFKYVVFNF